MPNKLQKKKRSHFAKRQVFAYKGEGKQHKNRLICLAAFWICGEHIQRDHTKSWSCQSWNCWALDYAVKPEESTAQGCDRDPKGPMCPMCVGQKFHFGPENSGDVNIHHLGLVARVPIPKPPGWMPKQPARAPCYLGWHSILMKRRCLQLIAVLTKTQDPWLAWVFDLLDASLLWNK